LKNTMKEERGGLPASAVDLYLDRALPGVLPEQAYSEAPALARLTTSGQEEQPGNGRPHDQVVADQVMADISSAMLDFLRTTVDSLVKWDLVRFFSENPHTRDTAESITRYTGRNPEATQAELEDLAARGLLVEEHLGNLKVYSLTEDPATRTLTQQFCEAAKDPRFRLQAIYDIVRRLG
jgi:hypothetical protein